MAEQTETMKVQTGPAPTPAEETFSPLVDIFEEADGTTVIAAEMPGVKGSTLEITVDKGVLTIQGKAEVPAPEGAFSETYRGFTGGQYFRAFALSDEIDRDRIEATLANGLLTVRLPKAASARTRKIEIKSE